MRRKLIATVAAIGVGAGTMSNAMAFEHSAFRGGSGDSRLGGSLHGGVGRAGARWHGGDVWTYGRHSHYGALGLWGVGRGLGVFGYDDRYCSPSYHACDVYGR
jgi:hypothetical protein